jgi:hypothetical protein
MVAVVGSPNDPFLELLPTATAVVRAEEGMVVASPSDPFLQQSVSQIFFNCVKLGHLSLDLEGYRAETRCTD